MFMINLLLFLMLKITKCVSDYREERSLLHQEMTKYKNRSVKNLLYFYVM